IEKNGRALQQWARLGRLCANRRVADHGTESRLLRRSGQGIAETVEKLRFQGTHASLLINFRSHMKEKSVSARRLTKPAKGACLELPVASVSHSFPVIAMAASVGGLKALSIILGGLPADFPAAIAIVMHVAPDHKSLLTEILKCRTHLQVTEAHTGDVLVPSKVFVGPPNHHLFVVKGDHLKLSSSHAEKIHFARPSAEPLFASVAE